MADSNDTNTVTPATGGGLPGIVLYPIQPYLLLAVSLLLVGCFQWGAYFHARFTSHRRFMRDEESMQSSRRGTSGFSLPLAVINLYRVLAFRTTIGFRSYVFNLAEVFVTVAYVAILLIWTFVITSKPDGEPLNWCSRAGILAASQFPFIAILGTKNNIVSVITRIGPDKLNFFHRLTARACLVFVGIHALGGSNNFSFYGKPTDTAKMFGIVAGITFAGLAVVSFRPVREKAYELFFYLHFVGIIVIMIATAIHIDDYVGVSFTYYIWPAFALWAIDRLIRTSRLVYFNLAYLGSSSQKSAMLDATTELITDSLIRVRFRRPKNFHWSPGQFAYLIMPSVSRLPFEAHPFSIASVDSVLFAPEMKLEDSSHAKELTFLIGVRSGFTKRLKETAVRRERVKVYVDGPYGEPVNLGCFHTSLLIAGGTGITYALPALLSIIESARNGSSCCRRVVLIWSIRDAAVLDWGVEALTKAVKFAPPDLRVDIQVFMTGSSNHHSRPYLSSSGFESQNNLEATRLNPFQDQNPFEDSRPPSPFGKPEDAVLSAPWLRTSSGRPNLEQILQEEISGATGRLSVSVCGPNAMAKLVRKALQLPWSGTSSPMNGGPSVTLHVESFGYA